MMNWPTAFVIAVAICAGAFLHNKPSDAAFGGSDRGIIELNSSTWIQFDGNKQRYCKWWGRDAGPSKIKCEPSKTD